MTSATIGSSLARSRAPARRRRGSRRRRRAPPRRSAGRPAPGPDIVTSVIAGASTMTALKGPLDRRQRVAAVEEAGEDADADPAVAALGDAEQLQREAELLGVGEVVGLDRLDPLVGDLVERDRGVEGEAGEDRHLRRGVGAVDVVGRVGLGVAELLGPRQHLLVGGAGRRHLAEDEVGGAVDDPEDLGDLGRRRSSPGSCARSGSPPATAASKRSCTPASRATAKSSSPCWASSCLLAVTTGLAGAQRGEHVARGPARCRRSARRSGRSASRISPKSPSLRVRTPAISGRRPVAASTASARSASSSAKAAPTVPRPSSPMRTGFEPLEPSDIARGQVLVGLAPDDDARLAVAAEDDRRPRHAVVVARHRVAVGAGRRGDEDVADGRARPASRRGRGRRRTRSACRRSSPACRAGRRRGRRSALRSGSRRASAAGCRTCRRRRRRRCGRRGSP